MGEVGLVIAEIHALKFSKNLHVSVDSNKYVRTCLTVHTMSLPFVLECIEDI